MVSRAKVGLNMYASRRILEGSEEKKFLDDISANGKERKWKERKRDSEKVAASFGRLSARFADDCDLSWKYVRKMEKTDNCGTFLEFQRMHDGILKLRRAYFCKDRLCPLCMWRRSLKIYGIVSGCANEIAKSGKYAFLLLTFTIRNVFSDDLSKGIDVLLKGYHEFWRIKEVNKSFCGAFRALEVTRKNDPESEWDQSYHPHLHCLFVVEKQKYFSGGFYVDNEKLQSLWKQSCRLDYDPIVYIREVYESGHGGIEEAVAEVAKYVLKGSDVVPRGSPPVLEEAGSEHYGLLREMDDNIHTLSEALFNRRLVSFRGVFGKVKRQLYGQEDVVDGDLVHLADDGMPEEEVEAVEWYYWNRYCADYVKTDYNPYWENKKMHSGKMHF